MGGVLGVNSLAQPIDMVVVVASISSRGRGNCSRRGKVVAVVE